MTTRIAEMVKNAASLTNRETDSAKRSKRVRCVGRSAGRRAMAAAASDAVGAGDRACPAAHDRVGRPLAGGPWDVVDADRADGVEHDGLHGDSSLVAGSARSLPRAATDGSD